MITYNGDDGLGRGGQGDRLLDGGRRAGDEARARAADALGGVRGREPGRVRLGTALVARVGNRAVLGHDLRGRGVEKVTGGTT